MSATGKRPTLNDVARQAGVSRATASRALGGYGRIKAETIAKVEETASSIGYRPNRLAQAMRMGRTRTVGLVILSDFTNAYFDRATRGIVNEARDQGLQVLIANTDGNLSVEEAAVLTLIDKQIDGLIVVPSSPTEFGHLTEKRIGQLPLVLFDRGIEGFNASSVTTDDFAGAQLAAEYVVSRGHRRLGLIIATTQLESVSSPESLVQISTTTQRREGFLRGVLAAGLTLEDVVIGFAFGDSVDCRRAAREMLDHPNPPTAILTTNNQIVIALLQEVSARGLVVGSNISVLTFDDSPWAQVIPGGLTVVSRPVEQLASLAVKTLLEKIHEPGTPAKELVLSCALTVRGSVSNLDSDSHLS